MRFKAESCAHAGEHESVAAVGLGEFSRGLGEASGLAGIDLDQGQADLGERPLEQAMIGAGGLEDDASDVKLPEPSNEGEMAVAVVCDAEGLAGRVDGDVESVFRNVDADALCYR